MVLGTVCEELTEYVPAPPNPLSLAAIVVPAVTPVPDRVCPIATVPFGVPVTVSVVPLIEPVKVVCCTALIARPEKPVPERASPFAKKQMTHADPFTFNMFDFAVNVVVAIVPERLVVYVPVPPVPVPNPVMVPILVAPL